MPRLTEQDISLLEHAGWTVSDNKTTAIRQYFVGAEKFVPERVLGAKRLEFQCEIDYLGNWTILVPNAEGTLERFMRGKAEHAIGAAFTASSHCLLEWRPISSAKKDKIDHSGIVAE